MKISVCFRLRRLKYVVPHHKLYAALLKVDNANVKVSSKIVRSYRTEWQLGEVRILKVDPSLRRCMSFTSS